MFLMKTFFSNRTFRNMFLFHLRLTNCSISNTIEVSASNDVRGLVDELLVNSDHLSSNHVSLSLSEARHAAAGHGLGG